MKNNRVIFSISVFLFSIFAFKFVSTVSDVHNMVNYAKEDKLL